MLLLFFAGNGLLFWMCDGEGYKSYLIEQSGVNWSMRIDLWEPITCWALISYKSKENIHNYLQILLKYALFSNQVSLGGQIFFTFFNQNVILQKIKRKRKYENSFAFY